MKKIIIALLVFISGFNLILGQELPEPPNPPRLVNDYAGLLSTSQINALERKLVDFDNINSSQIAIVIVNDLQGYDIASYSQKLAQKWGIGQKKYNNGVIIVLKPKSTSEKGEVNIDVGYGIEHLIPDITAKDIIDFQMIPIFKNNDYYGGLNSESSGKKSWPLVVMPITIITNVLISFNKFFIIVLILIVNKVNKIYSIR